MKPNILLTALFGVVIGGFGRGFHFLRGKEKYCNGCFVLPLMHQRRRFRNGRTEDGWKKSVRSYIGPNLDYVLILLGMWIKAHRKNFQNREFNYSRGLKALMHHREAISTVKEARKISCIGVKIATALFKTGSLQKALTEDLKVATKAEFMTPPIQPQAPSQGDLGQITNQRTANSQSGSGTSQTTSRPKKKRKRKKKNLEENNRSSQSQEQARRRSPRAVQRQRAPMERTTSGNGVRRGLSLLYDDVDDDGLLELDLLASTRKVPEKISLPVQKKEKKVRKKVPKQRPQTASQTIIILDSDSDSSSSSSSDSDVEDAQTSRPALKPVITSEYDTLRIVERNNSVVESQATRLPPLPLPRRNMTSRGAFGSLQTPIQARRTGEVIDLTTPDDVGRSKDVTQGINHREGDGENRRKRKLPQKENEESQPPKKKRRKNHEAARAPILPDVIVIDDFPPRDSTPAPNYDALLDDGLLLGPPGDDNNSPGVFRPQFRQSFPEDEFDRVSPKDFMVPGTRRDVPRPKRRFGPRFKVAIIVDIHEMKIRKGFDQKKLLQALRRGKVLIDDREHRLIAELHRLGVGDYIWVALPQLANGKYEEDVKKGYVLNFVVERKGSGDVAASLADGRFHEQRFRLRRCGMKYIWYLLEGELDRQWTQTVNGDQKEEMRAAASLFNSGGVKILRSRGGSDTAKVLVDMTKVIQQMVNERNITELLFREVKVNIKMFNDMTGKGKNLSLQDIFARALMGIKGMSIPKVLAIVLEKFPTPISLFRKYMELPDDKARRNLFTNVKLPTRFDNMTRIRKFGPVVSERIFNAMMGPRRVG